MDADLAKTIFPIVGGALALAGGVFTFVSGRLRDAEGPDAKAQVFQATTFWIAAALWLIGSALTAISGLQLYAAPFYLISFGLLWKLYLDVPRRPSRTETSMFSVLCAVTAFAVLASISFHIIDRLVSVQEGTQKNIERIVKLLKPAGN